MSIWNKILAGFVFVAAVAFFYMGARTLKMRDYWGSLAKALNTKIEAVEKENLLIAGKEQQLDDSSWNIRNATVQLHEVLVDRGRTWANCTPKIVDPKTGDVVLTVASTAPHQIAEKTSLTVFSENEIQDGGSYLGEFTVTKVDGNKIEMTPMRKMTQAALERLIKATGTWSLYDIMPTDNQDIFAELGEQDLIALLPKTTVGEYIKDGGKDRKLRNYSVLFREFHRHLSMMTDMFEAATRDKQYIDSALSGARQQAEFRQEEIDQLKNKLSNREQELGIVSKHQKALEAKVVLVHDQIGNLIKKNTEMADQIALMQREATRRIDAITRDVASLTEVETR